MAARSEANKGGTAADAHPTAGLELATVCAAACPPRRAPHLPGPLLPAGARPTSSSGGWASTSARASCRASTPWAAPASTSTCSPSMPTSERGGAPGAAARGPRRRRPPALPLPFTLMPALACLCRHPAHPANQTASADSAERGAGAQPPRRPRPRTLTPTATLCVPPPSTRPRCTQVARDGARLSTAPRRREGCCLRRSLTLAPPPPCIVRTALTQSPHTLSRMPAGHLPPPTPSGASSLRRPAIKHPSPAPSCWVVGALCFPPCPFQNI